MKTIKQQLAALRKRESRCDKMALQVKELYTEVTKGWSDVKQRIKDGETTGSKLKDLIIVRYGLPSEEIEQRFRDLQARLDNRQGQYVMVMQKKQERICFRGPGQERDSDYATKTELEIGVLTDDQLIIDSRNGQFYFPTGGKHATCWRPRDDEPVTIHDGNLTLHLFEDNCLKTSPDLKIFVGDEEVSGWFAGQSEWDGYAKVFCELNRLAGRSIEFPKLMAYLKEERTKVAEEFKSLIARTTWLQLELKRIGALGRKDADMSKELEGTPKKSEVIVAKAAKLGMNYDDLHRAMEALP